MPGTAEHSAQRSGSRTAQNPRRSCASSGPFAHDLRAWSGKDIDKGSSAIYVGLSIRRGHSRRPSALLNVEHSSTTSPQGTVNEKSLAES